MNPKKAVKELDKQLRKDPGNLVLRIRLAGALYQVGRWPDAVQMYRSVAMAYQAQGRIDQAIAVCHSVLEIAPGHPETRQLLTELEVRSSARAAEPAPPSHILSGEPQQVRQRPAPRPSGFETDSLTPGSEAEMVSPARITRDSSPGRTTRDSRPARVSSDSRPARGSRDSSPSRVTREATPTDEGQGRRQGRLPLPLPLNRTMHGPGIAPQRPQRTLRHRPHESGAGSAASAPTAPAPPNRLPIDDDDEAPTRIADEGMRRKGSLPIRSLTFGGDSREMADVTAPEPTGARLTPTFSRSGRPTPASQTPPQQLQAQHSSPGEALDDAFTAPRGQSLDEPSTPTSARADQLQGEDERTVFDDEREISMAFKSSFVEDNHDPGGVVATDVDLTLLPGLPPMAAQAIAKGMTRMRVRAGEMILREGESGDSCFVLAAGEARVLKRDPTDRTGQVLEVSRLSVGELFGEMALLGDSVRHASVQAVGDCELLEIPRDHLEQVTAQFPEISAYLETFYRERLIATLVGTAPFFRPLEHDDRRNLVKNFRFTRVTEGTRIISEGQKAGGFYLVVLGSVEITKVVSEHRQVLLATLGEGSYFGEMSLLRGDTARATVTALGPTELAVLPAKNFYALVASHPILWDQVRQEAHRRELETVQIVTGVTGSV